MADPNETTLLGILEALQRHVDRSEAPKGVALHVLGYVLGLALRAGWKARELGTLQAMPYSVGQWLADAQEFGARSRRNDRQEEAQAWVHETFGEASSTNVLERVNRLLEEVIELAQAEDLDEAHVRAIARHVFSKPAGVRDREVGGVGLTLLAYCEAVGLSADGCETKELARVLGIDRETFRERQAVKAAAGVGMPCEGEAWGKVPR